MEHYFHNRQEEVAKPETSKELESGRSSHLNASLMLNIEELLTEDIAFTDEHILKHDPNCKIRIDEANRLIEKFCSSGNKEKDARIREALKLGINSYINEKISAKRTELDISAELGQDASTENWGRHLFFLRTGMYPQETVRAYREDGYFVVHCPSKDDQLKFFSGKEEVNENDRTVGGSFHETLDLGPNLRVKCLLLRDRGGQSRIKLHERQHWLNHVVYDSFRTIEFYEQNAKQSKRKDLEVSLGGTDEGREKSRKIKDELIAFLRDGLDDKIISNFHTLDLYKHLTKDLSMTEQEQLSDLMREIEERLNFLCKMFEAPRERAVLAYQLMSYPLLEFPDALKHAQEFYQKRWDEFTCFLPQDIGQLKTVVSAVEFNTINDAYLEIEGLVYSNTSLVMAIDLQENEAEKKRQEVKKELAEKRALYDALVKHLLPN
jgi:hypothetical protein